MFNKETLVQHSYVISELIKSTDKFPNNNDLPLLIYKGALLLKPDDEPDVVQALFKQNGYTNSWVGDVYDYDHFHTNTHEILAVYSGHAELIFGGDAGKCMDVNKGDVIIIPAGVAHKKDQSSDNFSCVGAYPDGKDFDMNRKKEPGDEKEISQLPVPSKDPVYGDEDGHLGKYWN